MGCGLFLYLHIRKYMEASGNQHLGRAARMKRIILPDPPNPSAPIFKGQLLTWQRAVYEWMRLTKQLSDDANRVNASPIGQQFTTTDYTLTTAVTGTTTGTDLSNFVASLVDGFTTAGYLSPVRKRTSE